MQYLSDASRTRSQDPRWRACRRDFGRGGDFLFGSFSLADCFYAPVVTRFITYNIAMDETARAYADAITSWAAMKEWAEGAAREEEARIAAGGT